MCRDATLRVSALNDRYYKTNNLSNGKTRSVASLHIVYMVCKTVINQDTIYYYQYINASHTFHNLKHVEILSAELTGQCNDSALL